jgi:hypothetical protein
MIPKICNVVWLGAEMPEREKAFLENNKRILNDYVVNVWDNKTSLELISGHPVENFVKKAIQDKKWAFAADAIKLIALEKYGGWSIDADNEILKSFNNFLHLNWVSGFEIYHRRLKPITAVWGATPNHLFTQRLLSVYLKEDYSYLTTKANTKWISKILFSNGIQCDNTNQYCKELDVNIFPAHVFCGPKIEGQETYSLHHFNGSWL